MTKPKIKHDDWDDEDFEDSDSEQECQTCGGEYPNGCICYVKGKRPIWITT
jgi:hypothetical protein